MHSKKHLLIWTDGGSRGNPGPAGIGAVIQDAAGKVCAEISEYIGTATNNQAEYLALYTALQKAHALKATDLDVRMDSLLVIEQLNRRYKVKDAGLQKRFLEVWNLLQEFQHVRFTHIPRTKNTHADALVNAALDRHAEV